MANAAVMNGAVNGQPYDQSILDSTQEILERKTAATDETHQQKVYDLRLINANVLDITTSGTQARPMRQDGRFADQEVTTWEEARHNPVTSNTAIQSKSLSFNKPDFQWQYVRAGAAKARTAWYLAHYDKQDWATMYQQFLLDAIISGEGTIVGGVRNGECFLEYADALDVRWDTAFKEQHKRRFMFRDIHLPASEAVTLYPSLSDKINYRRGDAGCERPVTVTIYWSKTTKAVIYNNEFIEKPSPNPYERIPACTMHFFKIPGVAYPKGSVEDQIGTLQQILLSQRHFREVMRRGGASVGVASGFQDEAEIDQIQSGEESVVLRSAQSGARFEWARKDEVSQTALKLYELMQQAMNAESGVNDFQRSQTDVNVDFASQLTFLAQQSGVQAKQTAQQFEKGVVDSIKLFMDIGALFAGPIHLVIEGTEFDFGPEMPIGPVLGSDGEIILKPGGMQYKSAPQKLQESMVLGEAVSRAIAMPPGIAELVLKMVLENAEVDNAEAWVGAYLEGRAQMMAMQQAQQGAPPKQPAAA